VGNGLRSILLLITSFCSVASNFFLSRFRLLPIFFSLNNRKRVIIVCEHVYWDDLYSVWLEKLAKHVETWYIILGTPSSNKKKEFDFSSSTAINIVFCGHITAAFVYKFAKSDKLITSIPDLNTYHFQKSKTIKDFVYIQHSLVSSQMVYLENAFDNFDTVMCANEYQLCELERR